MTLFTCLGADDGPRAESEIDGATAATVRRLRPSSDDRGGASLRRARVPARTRSRCEVLGTKRPAAAGTRVAVDALRWGGPDTRRPSGGSRGVGERCRTPSASGGSYAISDVREAFARLRVPGDGRVAPHPAGTGDGSRGGLGGRSASSASSTSTRPRSRSRPCRSCRGWSTDPTPSGSWCSAPIARASSGNSVAVDRWLVVLGLRAGAFDLEHPPPGRSLLASRRDT